MFKSFLISRAGTAMITKVPWTDNCNTGICLLVGVNTIPMMQMNFYISVLLLMKV
jgi:hypothetical protein